MDTLKASWIIVIFIICTSFSGNDPSALSLQRMNVLYLGLDNPISISHPRYGCDKLILKLEPESLATLEPTACGEYKVKLKRRDRHGLNLLVYKNRVSDRTLLSKQNFRTLKVPTPIANFNGRTGGNITKEQLAKVKGVEIALSGFVYGDIRYEVSSYDYIYKPKKGDLIRGTKYGDGTFSNELLDKCLQAQEGDLIIISGIYANARSIGKVPLAGSLVFTVK